jgi:two-component system, NtrC family, response regulator PilR
MDDGALFVGTSWVIRKLRSDLERVAAIDCPVLFVGEPGAGTEWAARWLHRLSPRANQPFLKLNYGTLTEQMFDSELLGYQFQPSTPVNSGPPVVVGGCQGGTLFLDEITEIPAAIQVRLVDLMDGRESISPSDRRRNPDSFRVVGASSANMHEALRANRLSEDLYCRLNVFVFDIPPVRGRAEDIPMLLRRFITQHARNVGLPEPLISDELLRWSLNQEWPGNLKQLEAFAERYVRFGGDLALLAQGVDAAGEGFSPPPSDLRAHLRDMRSKAECAAISTALQHTNWNRKAAADLLHISYKSLLRKIRHYGLDRQERAAGS